MLIVVDHCEKFVIKRSRTKKGVIDFLDQKSDIFLPGKGQICRSLHRRYGWKIALLRNNVVSEDIHFAPLLLCIFPWGTWVEDMWRTPLCQLATRIAVEQPAMSDCTSPVNIVFCAPGEGLYEVYCCTAVCPPILIRHHPSCHRNCHLSSSLQ